MNKKREAGYYWVKFDGEWDIAYYLPSYDIWLSVGNDTDYKERQFEEINETRIKNPDEVGNE